MTTVHDEITCRMLRRHARAQGVVIGITITFILALILGTFLAAHQERSFDTAFALIQEQHRQELEIERKRIARYAEIDAVAAALDAARSKHNEDED